MVDDHEELLSNSVARLERVRYKHERLSKILISVKAGVEHLQDKLKSTATEVSHLGDEKNAVILMTRARLRAARGTALHATASGVCGGGPLRRFDV